MFCPCSCTQPHRSRVLIDFTTLAIASEYWQNASFSTRRCGANFSAQKKNNTCNHADEYSMCMVEYFFGEDPFAIYKGACSKSRQSRSNPISQCKREKYHTHFLISFKFRRRCLQHSLPSWLKRWLITPTIFSNSGLAIEHRDQELRSIVSQIVRALAVSENRRRGCTL